MKIELFDYELPQKFIAQKPLPDRDKSKLMVLNKKTGSIRHDFFYNITVYLNSGDVLVVNESKVSKCRLMGKKDKTGAGIECFVLKKLDDSKCLVLLKPSKRLKPSDKVITGRHYFTVKKKLDYGKAVVEFSQPAEVIFNKYGRVPLPPYIKNKDIDEERYQTVYADKEGSTAAPTAGLHFSRELIGKLEDKGIIFAKLNLDIGLDTFRPIKEDEIEKHKMHSESYYIRDSEADKIMNAKSSRNSVVAVGTTVARALETLMLKYGKVKGDRGTTDIYIYPGFRFRVIDRLVTNFHLPRSTLIVMVSAFAGRENIMNAYEEAKKRKYRFYSFGDCMFIK